MLTLLLDPFQLDFPSYSFSLISSALALFRFLPFHLVCVFFRSGILLHSGRRSLFVVLAESLSETIKRFPGFGRNVRVLWDWLTIGPLNFLKSPSSLMPLTRYRTRIVESASSVEFSGSISICGSSSEKTLSIIADFNVFGILPTCFSKTEFPLIPFFDLSADKMFDIPVFSRSIMICFRPNLLFLVRIIRSTLPFSRWSLSGHIICLINFSLLKGLNISLLKNMLGSVHILFGIPFAATKLIENSTTLSVSEFHQSGKFLNCLVWFTIS